jgi:hypothetical protein
VGIGIVSSRHAVAAVIHKVGGISLVPVNTAAILDTIRRGVKIDDTLAALILAKGRGLDARSGGAVSSTGRRGQELGQVVSLGSTGNDNVIIGIAGGIHGTLDASFKAAVGVEMGADGILVPRALVKGDEVSIGDEIAGNIGASGLVDEIGVLGN